MTGLFKITNCALTGLTVLLLFIHDGKTECVSTATSEGYVNLNEGGQACAPLQSDETDDDKGRRFITCSKARVYMQACPPGLRFDMRLGLCNWPHSKYCQLQGFNVEPFTITTRPTGEAFTSPTSANPSTSTQQPSTASSPGETTSQQTLSEPCNATSCQLPDCFCFRDNPAVIPLEDMPMFVMLTFDDHVSTNWYNQYYRALAVDNDYNLLNPSGSRPRFAFYVNDANTDYTKVKALWEAGHEIGSHSFHHRLPVGDKDSDYPEMVAEIQGLKDEVLRKTGNKSLVDSIIGFRAPYLLAGGNVQYDVLRDFGFVYDTSLFNINLLLGKIPNWPYTLDYVADECISPPCPTKPYPGLWSVPINGWIGDDQNGCSMADDCTVGSSRWVATEQQWYDYYRRNFEQYFYHVKVPMPIFIHSYLFDNYPRAHTALVRWLKDTLLAHKNVWLVSPSQVIKWMKNQMSNRDMIAQKWE